MDGIKFYPYIEDASSRLTVQTEVRRLIQKLPEYTQIFADAHALAEKYPESMAAKALVSFCDSCYPEKLANTDALLEELKNWLISADLNNN